MLKEIHNRGESMSDNDKLIIKPKKMRGNDGYKTFSIRILPFLKSVSICIIREFDEYLFIS